MGDRAEERRLEGVALPQGVQVCPLPQEPLPFDGQRHQPSDRLQSAAVRAGPPDDEDTARLPADGHWEIDIARAAFRRHLGGLAASSDGLYEWIVGLEGVLAHDAHDVHAGGLVAEENETSGPGA